MLYFARFPFVRHLLMLVLGVCVYTPASVAQTASSDVSFAKEILPLLKRNCIACHREGESEGGLSAETVKDLLAGGDNGPSLVAGDADGSLLIERILADEDERMPPPDNAVDAKPFTPKQIELVKRWINQGAPSDLEGADRGWQWHPIPESIRNSYASALSPDGQLAVVARANRVTIVDIASGQPVQELTDPQLQQAGIADHDMIQAIAISPLGDRIATGGYRSIRLWKRGHQKPTVPDALKDANGRLAVSPDRKSMVQSDAAGNLLVTEIASGNQLHQLAGDKPASLLCWDSPHQIIAVHAEGSVTVHALNDANANWQRTADKPIAQCTQSADAEWLVARCNDGSVQTWKQGQPHAIDAVNKISQATSLAILAGNQLIVGSGKTINWIDLAGGKQIRQTQLPATVTAIVANQAGTQFACATEQGSVQWINASDGAVAQQFAGDPQSQLQLSAYQQRVKFEQTRLDRLNKQTEGLKKAATKEAEALQKVQEAHDTAVKERDEKSKAASEEAQKLTALDQQLAATKADLAECQKLNQSLNEQLQKLNAAIKTQTEQVQALSKTVQQAKQQLDALNKQAPGPAQDKDAPEEQPNPENLAAIDKAKALVTAAMASHADAEKQLKNSQTLLSDTVRAQTEQQKLQQTHQKTIDAKTKERPNLEKNKQKLADELKQKQQTLIDRKQALATAKITRDSAAAAVPQHEQSIKQCQATLTGFQTQQTEHQTAMNSRAVVSLTITENDQSIIALFQDSTLVTFDPSTGHSSARIQVDDTIESGSGTLKSVNPQLVAVTSSHRKPRWVSLQQDWILESTIGQDNASPISDSVTSLDFHPDGSVLAAGSGVPSRNGQVLVVDCETGKLQKQLDQLHSDTVLSVRYSPDGTLLASAAADKSIRLIDIATDQVIGALDGHTHHAMAVDWRWDGQQLASGGADGTVRIWNFNTRQQERSIGGFPGEVTALRYLSATSRLAAAATGGQVRVVEANNGQNQKTLSASGDTLFTLDVSADATEVLSAGAKGEVRRWNLNDGKEISLWK